MAAPPAAYASSTPIEYLVAPTRNPVSLRVPTVLPSRADAA